MPMRECALRTDAVRELEGLWEYNYARYIKIINVEWLAECLRT